MHSAHREVHYGYIKVIISDVDDWMTPWTHLSVMPLHIHINTCRDTTRLHHSTTMTIISCCILSSPLPLNWPIPGSIDLDSLHYNSWTLYQSLSHSNWNKSPYHITLHCAWRGSALDTAKKVTPTISPNATRDFTRMVGEVGSGSLGCWVLLQGAWIFFCLSVGWYPGLIRAPDRKSVV